DFGTAGKTTPRFVTPLPDGLSTGINCTTSTMRATIFRSRGHRSHRGHLRANRWSRSQGGAPPYCTRLSPAAIYYLSPWLTRMMHTIYSHRFVAWKIGRAHV